MGRKLLLCTSFICVPNVGTLKLKFQIETVGKIMEQEIKKIIDALSTIHISNTLNENEIHEEIKKAFSKYNIKYKHEYQILTHKRFDFWMNGIVLEVKKSKPSKINLLNQLDRYTKVPAVRAIIVVLEKNITIPKQLNGKPIIIKSLNENWGVAL